MTTVALKRSLYGLMTAHVAATAVAWPLLPQQMPLHFGIDGRLIASAPASPVLWFLPSVLAWGIVALAIAASGPPESWKLTKSSLAAFRELNADDQRRVRDAKDRTLYVTMMLCVVCMFGLQAGIFIAADRELDHLPFVSDVVMFGSLAALVVVSVRGGRRVESLIRSAAEASGDASTVAGTRRPRGRVMFPLFLVMLVWHPPAAAGQFSDPLEAAVRYVIQLEGLDDYGNRLVLDVERSMEGEHGDTPDSLRARLEALAHSVGAVTGHLAEEVDCGPPNPSPEEYVTFRCAFSEEGQAVIIGGLPDRTESGAEVWVTVWIDTGSIAHTMARQVQLAFEPDEGWRATGIGLVEVP